MHSPDACGATANTLQQSTNHSRSCNFCKAGTVSALLWTSSVATRGVLETRDKVQVAGGRRTHSSARSSVCDLAGTLGFGLAPQIPLRGGGGGRRRFLNYSFAPSLDLIVP